MTINRQLSLLHSSILDIVRWLEKDLAQPLKLSDIVARSGYSKWYFQRAFKDVTGYPLAGYIRLRRLTTAAELLKSTSLQVSDIFISVGYDESSTFCRAFCAHFGLSPTQYRFGNDFMESRMIFPVFPHFSHEGVLPVRTTLEHYFYSE